MQANIVLSTPPEKVRVAPYYPRGVRLQMDNATMFIYDAQKFVSEIVRFAGDPEDGEGHAMRQIAARFAAGGVITPDECEQLAAYLQPGQLVVDDLPF